MLKVLKILVTAHALVGGAAMLSACGQKGALFLPSTPESAGRATLPQTLKVWPAQTAPASTSQPAGASQVPAASTPPLLPPTISPSNLPAAPKTTPP
ncbi:LPS translocon maturation chaperone LptM [Limnohabitans sp.]|uniref:LPS translocon maturation chaperone LptM n=1 Tax=Limnohabitans sp. TaxID=1907725 RepID=UPI002AFFB489|nr:lipoprotein [Limnohabitans sp.]